MNGDGLQWAALIAGILVANIAAVAGFFISLRVGLAVLTEKVVRLERDVNNLGDLYRKTKPTEESE